MFWSFLVGRVAGTAVRIHITFLLFLAWLATDAYFKHGLAEASRTLIFLVSVFGCVVAHEFGHVLAARMFGIATPDITLYPFGGVARLNAVPRQPSQEFFVAIAGPAVNVVIAAGLVWAGAMLTPEALLRDQADLGSRLAAANVVLALFNLLPAFPMDGGRVLRAALSAFMGFERATRLAAIVAHWLAIALALGGIFLDPMLIIIAVVILIGATAELQATAVRLLAKDRSVASAMITQFVTLPATANVADAAEMFLRTSQKVIPILEDSGSLLGVIQIGDVVRELYARSDQERSAAEIAVTDIPRLSAHATLDEAFRLLRENSASAVAIIDEDAKLRGLVTPETLSEMIMLYEASPSLFEGSSAASGSLEARNAIPQAVYVK
jgi:Zn-dependent protease/CBS domain-containing protein